MALPSRLRTLFTIIATLVVTQNLFLSFTLESSSNDPEKAHQSAFYTGEASANLNLNAGNHTQHTVVSQNISISNVPQPAATPSATATTTAPAPNKTLVILLGDLRGGETAWQTLYDNVLDVNSADLALMIGHNSTRSAYRNASLFDRATFHWEFSEYNDWADALDLIRFKNGTATGWRENVVPLMHPGSQVLGGVKMSGFSGSGGVIFMIRWFLTKKLQELQLTERYDRFILTRADHYYLCRHDISQMDPNRLWVPEGSDCGGITDRHLIVSSRHVLQALNVLPQLLTQPQEYKNLLRIRSGNPEKILYKSWKLSRIRRHIRRFDRNMFTCGETGDTTRWRELGELVEEGVRLKYADEYNQSRMTCGKQH